MTLRISRQLFDQIVDHALREHPFEACGVVAGRGGRLTRTIPITNADRTHWSYRFVPAEQLAAWAEMDRAGEDPAVIYHSHTASDAYPSQIDVDNATEPDAHYVIVSTRGVNDGSVLQFRSYQIVDGEATEELVELLD